MAPSDFRVAILLAYLALAAVISSLLNILSATLFLCAYDENYTFAIDYSRMSDIGLAIVIKSFYSSYSASFKPYKPTLILCLRFERLVYGVFRGDLTGGLLFCLPSSDITSNFFSSADGSLSNYFFAATLTLIAILGPTSRLLVFAEAFYKVYFSAIIF